MKNLLDSIIKSIKAVNDSRDNDEVIANDETNEELLNILREHCDAEDSEESLTEIFGYDGYCAIRDAERGFYPVVMSITNTEIADYDDDGSTIIVTAEDIDGNEEAFHVQTVDGEYRSDLGCWVTTPDSDGDIDSDDYPTFDMKEVISAAESAAARFNSEERTDYTIDNEAVYLINKPDGVEVVVENRNFINKYTSSYQRRFRSIKLADSKDDAIEYLEGLED